MRYIINKDWEWYFSIFAKKNELFLIIKYISIDLILKEDIDWLFDISTKKLDLIMIWDIDWLKKINSSLFIMIEKKMINKKNKLKEKKVRKWE